MTPEEARPILEPALAYAGGTHTYDDVCEMIEQGQLQFWPHPSGRSAIVTEILKAPRKKLLSFFLAGGRMEDLRTMHGPLVEWGKQQGCSEAILTGRAGWTRSFLAGAEGWTTGLVVMSKDLTDG